jgi:hypothetical protein
LRLSSTHQSPQCSSRSWRQDPMPDVFQIDDRGAVDSEVLHVFTMNSGLIAERTDYPPRTP